MAASDAAGFVVNSYEYDSYGRIEASIEGIANPFTYTGREQDPESGLYYYRARYYDPEIGRFLSEDPIGFTARDLNLYRYVGNNPVKFVDPDGLKVEVQWHEYSGTGWYHTATRITPENQSRWAADPRFQNFDEDGRRFATIGAERSILGNLVSDVNRPSDVASDGPSRGQVVPVTSPCGVSEDRFIERFLDLDRNFSDDIKYAPFPATPEDREWLVADDGYSSNSYTRGLIEAAGGSAPTPNVDAPGWDLPVPSRYFTPQRP